MLNVYKQKESWGTDLEVLVDLQSSGIYIETFCLREKWKALLGFDSHIAPV